MKQDFNKTLSLFSVLLLTGLTLLIFIAYLQSRVANTPPQDCVPTAAPVKSIGTATPTPDRVQQYNATSPPAASVTPRPIANIIDLAPGVADADKAFIYVRRCDGTYELFKADPNATTAIAAALQLKSGDFVADRIPPASLMGHYLPLPSATSP